MKQKNNEGEREEEERGRGQTKQRKVSHDQKVLKGRQYINVRTDGT